MRAGDEVSVLHVGRGEAGPEPNERGQLPATLRIVLAVSCVAPALTGLRAYVAYRMGVPAEGWKPLGDRLFGDLLENRPVFALLHTPDFFNDKIFLPVSYPPLSAVLLRVLYLTQHPVGVYVVIALAWLSVCCSLARRELVEDGIGRAGATAFAVLLLLTSFPIVGLLQRGNIELFVWICTATGVWAYRRDSNAAAGVLWGLASALKLYPFAFLLLLLSRRAYRGFFAGVVSFGLVSFAAILYLGPTVLVAAKGAVHLVFGYQGVRAGEWSMHELAANHSLFGLVKLVAVLANRSAVSWTLPYYLIGAALFLWLFFRKLMHMPETNQLLAVTAFVLMLPPISYFYTLVHLYAPLLLLILLLIRTERAGVMVPGLRTTILLFLPLLVSFTLLTYASVLLFAGFVQAIVLYGLLACAVQYPFAGDRESEHEQQRGKIISQVAGGVVN